MKNQLTKGQQDLVKELLFLLDQHEEKLWNMLERVMPSRRVKRLNEEMTCIYRAMKDDLLKLRDGRRAGP